MILAIINGAHTCGRPFTPNTYSLVKTVLVAMAPGTVGWFCRAHHHRPEREEKCSRAEKSPNAAAVYGAAPCHSRYILVSQGTNNPKVRHGPYGPIVLPKRVLQVNYIHVPRNTCNVLGEHGPIMLPK